MVIFVVHPCASPHSIVSESAETAVAIIPARYDSARLPGKPLADIAGSPMIEHVYKRVKSVPGIQRVLVATDDDRIASAVATFGGECKMTSPMHRSGMDRLAEVAGSLSDQFIINVQGDEPLIDPALVGNVLRTLRKASEIDIVTALTPICDIEEFLNPNIVKVTIDNKANALYFSRAPIPFCRQEDSKPGVLGFKHIGLYGYRRESLLRLSRIPQSRLECLEELEQLRALESNMRIRTIEAHSAGISVDTPDDLNQVRYLVAHGANQ